MRSPKRPCETPPPRLPALLAPQDMLRDVGCEVSSFQDVEREFAELPGRYATERQGLLFLLCNSSLARRCSASAVHTLHVSPPGEESPAATSVSADAIGCIALKRIEAGVGEVKRLYVRATYRRRGLAQVLTTLLETAAKSMGYRKLMLDSLERLAGAVSLYEGLGFRRRTGYVANPLPDAVFMEKVIAGDVEEE